MKKSNSNQRNMQNQILTSEELLNELNASLPSLSSRSKFKSSDFYLSSNSVPRLWRTYNTISSDSSSIPDTFLKQKSCGREQFETYSSDPDSSDVSQNNLKTSGPLTSSCSSNHQSRGGKIPSSSSSVWVPPPKRCKRFKKRTTAKNSKNSLNQLPFSNFTYSSNSLPELRTKLYKKYLREIESLYLKQRESIPNKMAEWDYQSESDESNQRLSQSSSSKCGSDQRRFPVNRRVNSPSTNLRFKNRSSSRRSSRTSSHHSRRSTTSELYTSSRFSSNSDSLAANRSSSASSNTVHHTRSRGKYSKDFGHLSRSYPRFCGDKKLHYGEYIPYSQQYTFDGPHNINCAGNKETDVSLSKSKEASSWLSFVLRSWPLVKISNFISVIKNHLRSPKEDTSYSNTCTPTLSLPSETLTSHYGNLDTDIQSILKGAHQPAYEGRHRFVSKSSEKDVDFDYDDSGVWESF